MAHVLSRLSQFVTRASILKQNGKLGVKEDDAQEELGTGWSKLELSRPEQDPATLSTHLHTREGYDETQNLHIEQQAAPHIFLLRGSHHLRAYLHSHSSCGRQRCQ